jgi:hypothetical protein
MSNLNFFGPFHFNDFNANGIYNPASRNNYTPADANGNATPIPDLNQPGIYIWGNLFDVNEKRELMNPTDCNPANFKYKPEKHQLIPYYVGKIESSLFNRLNTHRNVTIGHASKYIRFSYDYWKEFFKDPLYSRKSQDLIHLVQNRTNSVIYHNDAAVLRLIYPTMNIVQVGNNHPITHQLLNNQPLLDTLDEVVNGLKNFWFCFCPINKNDLSRLKEFEDYAFYSLKGKTTSNIGNYKNQDRNIVLNDMTNKSRIFKKVTYNNNSEIVFPLDVFWGY